ncbi:phage tail protein [Cellulosilyticum sp. I15G10I2]|uniref:phage tail protein n=1 Tax=Cellulosilyticum sp. I15G10I2 TaxID=1892843 RepID=UPI00085BB8F8|nr:phage tail protein [Cellulosilyticum sp. I15G10I2]
MYIATFGTKGFVVSADKTITFDDLTFAASLDTEKQDNPGKKPSTYVKNANLDTFSIKIHLDSALGVHPLDQINQWMKILDDAKPYPFLLNGKPFLDTKWLLVDVSGTKPNVDIKGNILSADVSLKFDEYVSKGNKKESSKSKKSTKTKKAKDTSSVYEALKPTEKAELKVSTATNFKVLERQM